MATLTLTFKRNVQAPAGEAFRAFTNATALRDWLADAAQADPRPQGRLYLWWRGGDAVTGVYGPLTPGKKSRRHLGERRLSGPTRVQVSFATRGTGAAVTVRHTLGTGRKWAAAARALARLWPAALENLGAVPRPGLTAHHAPPVPPG
jgi:uncharacterized protein YndB with AHSA1/START domain